MSYAAIITLVLFAILIIGYMKGYYTSTACAVVFFLYFFKVLDFETAFAGFASDTAMTFIGMFVLAAGINKTSLLDNLASRIVAKGDTETKLTLGIFAMGFVLSAFVNATTVMITLTPIILKIAKEANVSPKRFLKCAQNNATLWQGAIPFGGAAAIYMQLNGIIEAMGGKGTFDFWTLFIARLPMILVCTALNIFIMQKRLPKTTDGINWGTDIQVPKKAEKQAMPPFKEKLAYAIFIVTMVCVIFSNLLGIEVVDCAIIGALAMIFTGVLSEKEAIRAANLQLIAMYSGAIALASALKATGLTTLFGDYISSILGNMMNPYIIAAILFLAVSLCTQFMSNNGSAAIFRPLAALISVSLGLDARAAMMAVTIGANLSLMLPMGSPSMAMTYSTGGYTMKEYIMDGLPIYIAYFIVFMLFVPTVFPAI